MIELAQVNQAHLFHWPIPAWASAGMGIPRTMEEMEEHKTLAQQDTIATAIAVCEPIDCESPSQSKTTASGSKSKRPRSNK